MAPDPTDGERSHLPGMARPARLDHTEICDEGTGRTGAFPEAEQHDDVPRNRQFGRGRAGRSDPSSDSGTVTLR
jgi:hypothetical protein